MSRASATDGRKRASGRPSARRRKSIRHEPMGSRHPNPRLVKIHRNYSVEDIARLFGIHTLKSAPDEHGKIARALEGWREHSIYRLSLSDARLWPQSLQDADRLLDFFLLEKAFYEIEYELAYRLIGCGCRWPALGAFSWYAREY